MCVSLFFFTRNKLFLFCFQNKKGAKKAKETISKNFMYAKTDPNGERVRARRKGICVCDETRHSKMLKNKKSTE